MVKIFDRFEKAGLAAKTDEYHPQENIQHAERHTPSWYGFFRWPSGTTTWAIILTLLAITEQTKQTAKAAEATQKSAATMEGQTGILKQSLAHAENSAKAANDSAQALVNSERAWIM